MSAPTAVYADGAITDGLVAERVAAAGRDVDALSAVSRRTDRMKVPAA